MFEEPKHHIDLLRSSGAPGRTRTCVHFVRSEGHLSALARTLKPLVGELRIELSPRAPKARMQRITPFPDWCQPSELNAALSVFSGAYRPRIRDWRNLVDRVGIEPT